MIAADRITSKIKLDTFVTSRCDPREHLLSTLCPMRLLILLKQPRLNSNDGFMSITLREAPFAKGSQWKFSVKSARRHLPILPVSSDIGTIVSTAALRDTHTQNNTQISGIRYTAISRPPSASEIPCVPCAEPRLTVFVFCIVD